MRRRVNSNLSWKNRYIKIRLINVEVEPYISPVIQCFKCLRFGHTKNLCKGQHRCSKCGSKNHNSEECDTGQIKCIYCKEEHEATYKKCEEFKTQTRIKKLMSLENLSF